MSKIVELPTTAQGMHELIIELAMVLDEAWCGGDCWDMSERNVPLFLEAEDILLKGREHYDGYHDPDATYETPNYKTGRSS